MKFDTRTLSSPLPLAYPSLLKQQLHDLMLRRKSLVQEEPEDEAALEAQLFSRLRSGSGSTALRTQLKTGEFDTLIFEVFSWILDVNCALQRMPRTCNHQSVVA